MILVTGILSKRRYAYEIEIKTNIWDFRREKAKTHAHYSTKLKGLYFAVPENIAEIVDTEAPEYAGILAIAEDDGNYCAKIKRSLHCNKYTEPLVDDDIFQLLRLAHMRVWTLKEHLYRLRNGSPTGGLRP